MIFTIHFGGFTPIFGDSHIFWFLGLYNDYVAKMWIVSNYRRFLVNDTLFI